MISVLIATAARSELLGRTLHSLSQCERPRHFAGVTVVENGTPGSARSVCDRDYAGMPVKYLWSDRPGKNAALGLGLEGCPDEQLVILSDDDILFSGSFLTAYHRALQQSPSGCFFGGPFEVDYEQPPAQWLRRYLPLSALGWNPEATDVDPQRTWFLGFNWAALAGDLRRVGGFDPRLGPGSRHDGTGDEVAMQKAMHRIGLQSVLAPEALVWHHVPADRCTPQWVLGRARRDGIARGQYVRQRRGARLVAGHVQHALRLISSEARLRLSGCDECSPEDFKAAYRRNKAAGYFSVFRKAS